MKYIFKLIEKIKEVKEQKLTFLPGYGRNLDHQVGGIHQQLLGQLHAQNASFSAVAVGVQSLRPGEQHVPRIVALFQTRKHSRFILGFVHFQATTTLSTSVYGVDVFAVVEVHVVLVAGLGRLRIRGRGGLVLRRPPGARQLFHLRPPYPSVRDARNRHGLQGLVVLLVGVVVAGVVGMLRRGGRVAIRAAVAGRVAAASLLGVGIVVSVLPQQVYVVVDLEVVQNNFPNQKKYTRRLSYLTESFAADA